MSVDVARLRAILRLLEEHDAYKETDETAETTVVRALIGLAEALDNLGDTPGRAMAIEGVFSLAGLVDKASEIVRNNINPHEMELDSVLHRLSLLLGRDEFSERVRAHFDKHDLWGEFELTDILTTDYNEKRNEYTCTGRLSLHRWPSGEVQGRETVAAPIRLTVHPPVDVTDEFVVEGDFIPWLIQVVMKLDWALGGAIDVAVEMSKEA